MFGAAKRAGWEPYGPLCHVFGAAFSLHCSINPQRPLPLVRFCFVTPFLCSTFSTLLFISLLLPAVPPFHLVAVYPQPICRSIGSCVGEKPVELLICCSVALFLCGSVCCTGAARARTGHVRHRVARSVHRPPSPRRRRRREACGTPPPPLVSLLSLSPDQHGKKRRLGGAVVQAP